MVCSQIFQRSEKKTVTGGRMPGCCSLKQEGISEKGPSMYPLGGRNSFCKEEGEFLLIHSSTYVAENDGKNDAKRGNELCLWKPYSKAFKTYI